VKKSHHRGRVVTRIDLPQPACIVVIALISGVFSVGLGAGLGEVDETCHRSFKTLPLKTS
jgi:hypothetical protein